MTIVDIFHLEDGRTVLAGSPELGGAELHGISAQLIVDGWLLMTLRVDAVEFPRRIKPPAERLFAVETRDAVDLGSERAQQHNYVLRIDT
ncbi:MAG: hypothetical protein JOZ75_10705 [Candidatus Dormibacteraeota bacterium]|nr:hypothetical protein [Candidatus Dormibacteraeota bacterium]